MFKVFQQVETVLVTTKVLEASLIVIRNEIFDQEHNFSSRSILIEKKGTIVLAATVLL